MPEKVTLLNGLKVTSEYWSYKFGVYNLSYVKFRDVFEKIYVLYHPLSAYPLMHDLNKSRGTSRALTIKSHP